MNALNAWSRCVSIRCLRRDVRSEAGAGLGVNIKDCCSTGLPKRLDVVWISRRRGNPPGEPGRFKLLENR